MKNINPRATSTREFEQNNLHCIVLHIQHILAHNTMTLVVMDQHLALPKPSFFASNC